MGGVEEVVLVQVLRKHPGVAVETAWGGGGGGEGNERVLCSTLN